MPLTRRYTPEWYPGETSNIGMDFSYVIPPGIGIAAAWLAIEDLDTRADRFADFTGPPPISAAQANTFTATVVDRMVYCRMSGGVAGRDYTFIWTAIDSDDNVFPREGLILCQFTS
jgi:hypothetical protein